MSLGFPKSQQHIIAQQRSDSIRFVFAVSSGLIIMSTQLCKLVVLTVRRPGCRVPWRMDSGQVVLTTMGLSQSRAYSLDSLSPGPGRSSLGHSNQQPRVEGISASSALTHRNLSAVAVQGQRRPLCQHDFLDIGDMEENLSMGKAKFLTR
ncbi:hypothetical protein CRUP_020574, partial [Coryphaenoides rupestris]